MDKMVLPLPSGLVHDRRKDGWTLLEDTPLVGTSTLELVEFDPYVNGNTILERAKELGDMAGQRHAERMLACAGKIPGSWRDVHLVFPGTVWQDAYGSHRSVPCLSRRGVEWGLHFGWFDNYWNRYCRLVRLSPP